MMCCLLLKGDGGTKRKVEHKVKEFDYEETPSFKLSRNVEAPSLLNKRSHLLIAFIDMDIARTGECCAVYLGYNFV
jgi:hypothetical protein